LLQRPGVEPLPAPSRPRRLRQAPGGIDQTPSAPGPLPSAEKEREFQRQEIKLAFLAINRDA